MAFQTLIALCIAFVSSAAFADDYDALLAKQTEYSITGISKPERAYGGSPESVCASLGYTRVVSSQSEACTLGELMYFRVDHAGVVGPMMSNEAGGVVCGKMGQNSRLISVVCAK